MPGKHSVEKLAARRTRALARGFLVPRPEGARHVLVAEAVADRVKAVARSLTIQDAHHRLVGSTTSFARSSTREARSLLSESVYRNSMKDHDRANLAKHSWTEAGPSLAAAFVSTSPLCGAPVSQCPSPSRVASMGTQTAIPESSVDTGIQTDDLFSPTLCPQPWSCALPSHSLSTADHFSLIEAQNSTIAILTGRLDSLVQGAPSQKRLRELEKQHML